MNKLGKVGDYYPLEQVLGKAGSKLNSSTLHFTEEPDRDRKNANDSIYKNLGADYGVNNTIS
jgi:hypothetical protein